MTVVTQACQRALLQQRTSASFGRISSTRKLLARSTSLRVGRRGRATLRPRAKEEDSAEEADSASSLFAQELKRRGLSLEKDSEQIGEAGSAADRKKAADDLLKRASGQKPAPSFAPDATQPSNADDQLARSRALQSEGLEGFPARAAELLKLGSSFFLSFAPLVGATVGAVLVTYLIFGSDFVHGGSARGPPAYVEPEYLLNEPTVDRMVPLQSPQTVGDYY